MVLSKLVGLIDARNFLKALALVAVLVITSFIAQATASRLLRERDRTQLFSVLTALSLSRDVSVHRSSILSEAEVLAIEAAATEVWVYAYDLAWENPDSGFPQTVRRNLEAAVRYRYLIPDNTDVRLQMEQLIQHHSKVRRVNTLLKCKMTKHERLITHFGMTIYNPTLLKEPRSGVDPKVAVPIVVFFPHFVDFSVPGHSEEVFLAVGGPSTKRIQEAFVRYWDDAESIAVRHRDL